MTTMNPAQANSWVAYADGSCIGNPGPGGWGVVLFEANGEKREFCGADPSTTNNRMEITAAIEALRQTPAGVEVELHSDSQYLIKTMTLGWKRRENTDLWRLLDAEAARRRVAWRWVRGHAGDPLNERADELARAAAEGRALRPPLKGKLSHKEGEPLKEIETRLTQLLRPEEKLRQCAHCARSFVAAPAARYCSLAECQLEARSG